MRRMKQPLKTICSRVTEDLKLLLLPAMRREFEREAERARVEAHGFEQYLLTLAEHEIASRSENRIARLLKESRLPLEKTLEMFHANRLPRRISLQLPTLVEGTFVDRKENLLAFGNPGSGKTHLVCAIGHELVRRGRSVLFTPASHLIQDLLRAKRDLRLERALKSLRKYSALIVDDIGYVQHDRSEMEVLFALLADRYERGSIVLTSNLPFSRWEEIFKDPMTTAAAIDRLVHHSVILELNVRSYRLEQAQQTSQTADKVNHPEETKTSEENDKRFDDSNAVPALGLRPRSVTALPEKSRKEEKTRKTKAEEKQEIREF
jgi:DNA replication protein DnaC